MSQALLLEAFYVIGCSISVVDNHRVHSCIINIFCGKIKTTALHTHSKSLRCPFGPEKAPCLISQFAILRFPRLAHTPFAISKRRLCFARRSGLDRRQNLCLWRRQQLSKLRLQLSQRWYVAVSIVWYFFYAQRPHACILPAVRLRKVHCQV